MSRWRIAAAAVVIACGSAGSALCGEAAAGTVNLSGAWALYPMAVKWGEEFTRTHPQVKFNISAGGAGKGMTDVLSGAVDFGMVSREINEAELAKGAVAFAVARDAVVPVVSAKNPFLRQLLVAGIARSECAETWLSSTQTWAALCGGKGAVRVYTRSDACGAAETWAKYLGARQENLKGTGVYGDPGIGEAVRRDAMGIGYNNVNFAYDSKSGKPVEGLAILPLDLDGDGRVSRQEAFYSTRGELLAAIADGKYPSPPARDLFLVTRGRLPAGPARMFLEWVFSGGQDFVEGAGYIKLPAGRIEKETEALGGGE